MQTEGSGERQGLVEVLLTLGRLRQTGILTIQSDKEIIGLSFLDGEIVSADALNESLEEGLGEVLASRDLVNPEQFASLVAEYDAGGGRVTDLLVERGLLAREALVAAMRWHNYLLCRQVLSWAQCDYKFYSGSEVTKEDGVRPLPVEELLVRAAEDLGAAGPLPGEMPVGETIFQQTERQGAEAGRDELLVGLATGESGGTANLLREMDGHRSAAELAERAGVSEFEARLALYLLERTGQARATGVASGGFLSRASRHVAAATTEDGFETGGKKADWFGVDGLAQTWREKLSRLEVDWRPWPARILGLLIAVVLMVVILTEPGELLLPFPWQEGLRQAMLDDQTSAAYLKIDRAAKTSFLLDGHFPETLEGLQRNVFLTPQDLVDPAGRRLGYAAQVAGYLIYPLDEGEAAPGASRTETVTGNFLLDPEFVPDRAVKIPPLVLLD